MEKCDLADTLLISVIFAWISGRVNQEEAPKED